MRSLEIETNQLQDFKSPGTLLINPDQSIVISNVFGINKEGELPARFLSGFLSTFSLAKTVKDLSDGQINPHVRIFRPVNITKHINGFSDEIATQQINQGNQMLESLASLHFPTVEFSIDDDTPVSKEALDILSQLAKLIELHCDNELVGRIKESGRIRGGEQNTRNALAYAAHHPFGWGDLHHQAIFKGIPAQQAINTLPPSEKRYTEIRNGLKQVLESSESRLVSVRTRQELTISMCGTPHYIFLQDGNGEKVEPSLNDVLAVNCMEILEDMRSRAKTEQDMFLRENLRKAARDLEKVLILFAKGNNSVLREETVGSLLRI